MAQNFEPYSAVAPQDLHSLMAIPPNRAWPEQDLTSANDSALEIGREEMPGNVMR